MNNRIADCRKRKIDRDFFSKPADSILLKRENEEKKQRMKETDK